MNWLLMGLVIVAVIVVSKLIHFNHFKHKIFSIAVILLLAFLYFSFTSVVQGHSVDLKTASGIFSASKIYFSWFVHVFDNVKEISGNVVGMDWMPKNSSLTGAVTSVSGSGDGW